MTLKREPDQEEVLALALLLAQNYGDDNRGMACEDWIAEARFFGAKVQAVLDVFYAADDDCDCDHGAE